MKHALDAPERPVDQEALDQEGRVEPRPIEIDHEQAEQQLLGGDLVPARTGDGFGAESSERRWQGAGIHVIDGIGALAPSPIKKRYAVRPRPQEPTDGRWPAANGP